MDREEAEALLVASWGAPLAAEDAAELAAALESDPDLAALAATWDALGELDPVALEETPSERLRARFYAALAAAEAATRQRQSPVGWWTRPRALRLAAAVAWAAVGLAAGLGAAGWLSARAEVRALRSELRSTHETAMLALLEHHAASERLRAVSWSDRWGADDELVGALVEVVHRDPNANVRLAAVEALGGRIHSGAQRRELIESLPSQSPLLQVRLVELLYGGEKPLAPPDFGPLLAQGALDEAARQRLLELTRGRA